MTGDRLLRFAPAVLAAASAAILLAAFGFQYLGGLPPCPLCIWQRWPYAIVIVLGLAGTALAAGRRPPRSTLRALLALCGLVFLTGTGIALFHVGVEQHWWAGTAACGGGTGSAASVEALRRQLLDQPVVRCDTVAWSFLGLSMAGWNMLLSLGLAGLSFVAATAQSRSAKR